MKSSYYLILLIIGIIILHAFDNRKKRRPQRQVREPTLVQFDSLKTEADSPPALAASSDSER